MVDELILGLNYKAISTNVDLHALRATYQSLHHVHTLGTEVPNTLVYTESGLGLHLLHHHIQSDESASAPNTCTAVYQQWLVQEDGELFAHMTYETDERHDILRNTMIWPCSVVELSHCQWFLMELLLYALKYNFLHSVNDRSLTCLI